MVFTRVMMRSGAAVIVAIGASLPVGCVTTGPTGVNPRLTFVRPAALVAPAMPTLAALTHARREAPGLAVDEVRKHDQPGEAAEFFRAQRLSVDVPDYPMERVLDQARVLKARQAVIEGAATPGDILSWQDIGPGNIGGRTRTLVIDPTQPTTMYAAGVNGGVWKSLDAGVTWAPLDDFLPNLAVSALTVDPSNPNILYAGTGEGVFPGSQSPRGAGIFKTTDAGATWTLLPATASAVPASAFHYVNKIVISPTDSNRVYAATRTGVWRSLDAGATWSVVLANPRFIDTAVIQNTNGCDVGCLDLVVRSDRTPDVLLASFGSFERDGLYRSSDGGDSWVEFQTGANQGRMSLAIAPSNNDVMYISMADNGVGGALGQLVSVFRSIDGGDTWTPRTDPLHPFGPWLLSNLTLATGCLASPVYSQGWHDNALAVDPSDPDRVWIGGIDLFRSDDGGQTFGVASYWFGEQTALVPVGGYAHADQHTIVFHPGYDGVTNQTMYVGSDGGVFRTLNARAATSQEDCPLPADQPLPEIVWAPLNNGYGVTQFYHGDSGQNTPAFVGGAQDNGSSQVLAVGAPNSWQSIFGGDGGYVAIDPTDAQTIYVEIQFFPEIRKSTNGGLSFALATNGITDTDGLFITPFVMDQSDPNVLWTGGGRPWRTLDGAATWTAAGPNLLGAGTISALAIAPSDSNVVYLGYNNGRVARSTNALAPAPVWTLASNGLRFSAWISSMAVDPVDPNIAYATYSTFGGNHIYKTVDGGASWAPIDGVGVGALPDIPTHWAAVRACNAQQVYLGTELGVYASDDGGASWAPVVSGLPTTVVESLDFRSDRELVAFTHGRGAFLATLAACAGCLGDLSGDGIVDGQDISFVLNAFGGSGPADLNGDGIVNGGDISSVLNVFGPCP